MSVSAWLRAGAQEPFPDPVLAGREGLLAAGGDLSVPRLLDAYRQGIFPWYSPGQPILWWSPDPRMVLATRDVHIARRLRRWMRHCPWTLHADRDFAAVMQACAAPRAGQHGTWIDERMLEAYCRLHALGYAHCVTVHDADRLVGGVYGVAIGRMFFGESMFSIETNASKVALIALCRVLHAWGFPLLDAQVRSAHLARMGALPMPRALFLRRVMALGEMPQSPASWRERWPLADVGALIEPAARAASMP